MSFALSLIVLSTPYLSTDSLVTFRGAGGESLQGTLSMPEVKGNKRVPGVILLPGSGPTDRDGNQPPALVTDVQKQISDNLVKAGFATFRFDKRAAHFYLARMKKIPPAQLPDYFKWQNFVGDATAAYKWLASQRNVDPHRMALIGHSEGAEISLQIASDMARDPMRPAAVVTLGGAGRPMGPILHEQIKRQLTKVGATSATQKLYLDFLDKATAQVAANATFPANPPQGLGVLFGPTTTKLMQDYCRIDPCNLARNVIGPVLVMNGARDSQVSAQRDTPRLAAALKSRKQGSVEVVIVPNASHCLKEVTKDTDDVFVGPIVPSALAKIKQFLMNRLHP